jgi:acetyl esterase
MARKLANRASARVLDGFFRSLSALGGAVPSADPARHGVERSGPLSFGPHGDDNLLDIYRPIERAEKLPVVLYIHGGGFRALSKDSHWLMGLAFARRGYLVFNINYRLGPEHPYPAAIEDACAAWLWAQQNAAQYGGDPNTMVLAGESAGANLAMALTIACCYQRPEDWAREVYEAGVVPRAIAPACGLFQVSDPERYRRAGLSNRFSQSILNDCEDCYLPEAQQRAEPGLADPLCVIEQFAPDRPLPPAFLPVGGRDPLKEDTKRMTAALKERGCEAVSRTYPGGIHAFHAFVFRKQARECWKEMLDFLGERLELEQSDKGSLPTSAA